MPQISAELQEHWQIPTMDAFKAPVVHHWRFKCASCRGGGKRKKKKDYLDELDRRWIDHGVWTNRPYRAIHPMIDERKLSCGSPSASSGDSQLPSCPSPSSSSSSSTTSSVHRRMPVAQKRTRPCPKSARSEPASDQQKQSGEMTDQAKVFAEERERKCQKTN